ncbi:porin [Microvirga alba]|uniref:Porin n=1 Tax=Microvirga alba TaxID=2791025 RepID=A0A931FSY3_9HYPH|nr:porin [Microvirga alba]MBF9234171.1 porin [Microvirga alba]
MKRPVLAFALSSLALIGQAEAAPQASSCPPGFVMLQDKSTCVRISGRVRADGLVGSPSTRGANAIEMRSSGRIQLDVRKQTEYGPLRAVIRAEGQAR